MTNHKISRILQELYPEKEFAPTKPLGLIPKGIRLYGVSFKHMSTGGDVAVEYGGPSHFRLGKDEQRFLRRIRKDALMAKLCKDLGITLIIVPYWARHDLKGFITNKIRN